MKTSETDLTRLMSVIDQSDCWFWDGVTYSPEQILYQDLCGVPIKLIKSKCHVAGCINPAHKIGGQNAVKLNGEKVRQIRASNKTSKDLAKEYGVSTQTIRVIWSGKSWANVPGERETAGHVEGTSRGVFE